MAEGLVLVPGLAEPVELPGRHRRGELSGDGGDPDFIADERDRDDEESRSKIGPS